MPSRRADGVIAGTSGEASGHDDFRDRDPYWSDLHRRCVPRTVYDGISP
jgi:hypothetical protein